jgi:hypothetical protein
MHFFLLVDKTPYHLSFCKFEPGKRPTKLIPTIGGKLVTIQERKAPDCFLFKAPKEVTLPAVIRQSIPLGIFSDKDFVIHHIMVSLDIDYEPNSIVVGFLNGTSTFNNPDQVKNALQLQFPKLNLFKDDDKTDSQQPEGGTRSTPSK